METRAIVNFRCWDMNTGEEMRWDSLGAAGVGGRKVTLPQEGTGERDVEGQEIFRGDVLRWKGVHYLVGFSRGGYLLLQLDGDLSAESSDVWLHDYPEGELLVVGNSRDNSDFVVEGINRRARLRKKEHTNE
jgi:hypothetical protein